MHTQQLFRQQGCRGCKKRERKALVGTGNAATTLRVSNVAQESQTGVGDRLLLHHVTQPPVLTMTRVLASAYCLYWVASLQHDPTGLLGTGMSSPTKAAHALPSAMESGTGLGKHPAA